MLSKKKNTYSKKRLFWHLIYRFARLINNGIYHSGVLQNRFLLRVRKSRTRDKEIRD